MGGLPVLFCCGPRQGGNSDTAGTLFAAGAARTGVELATVALREQVVRSCLGCGLCGSDPAHACPLAAGDRAEALFDMIKAAPFIAFASPIYFYHVPALFKAFIDRAQRHYMARLAGDPELTALPRRPAHVLLVSGRKAGERLFDGTLLTLKYFLSPFNVHLAEPCLVRGMDAVGDLAGNEAAAARVMDFGEAAARAWGQGL